MSRDWALKQAKIGRFVMIHIPCLGGIDIPDEMNDAELAAKFGAKAYVKISDFEKLLDDAPSSPNDTDDRAATELA
jgi:hypothetical protein